MGKTRALVLAVFEAAERDPGAVLDRNIHVNRDMRDVFLRYVSPASRPLIHPS